MYLLPGDIVLVQGNNWLSRSILWFERKHGEPKSRVSHAGIITRPNEITEALFTVVRRYFPEVYNGKIVTVYRPLGLDPGAINQIVYGAERYIGRSYGYLKIVAHALDRLIGGAYLFRRVAGMDNYPICSWVVAQAYAVVGLNFGVAPGAAEPDDLDDYCLGHPDKYAVVWPLVRWEA